MGELEGSKVGELFELGGKEDRKIHNYQRLEGLNEEQFGREYGGIASHVAEVEILDAEFAEEEEEVVQIDRTIVEDGQVAAVDWGSAEFEYLVEDGYTLVPNSIILQDGEVRIEEVEEVEMGDAGPEISPSLG